MIHLLIFTWLYMMLQICPLTPFLFGFSYSYAVTTLVHLKVQKYTYNIYALYTHTCTMWLTMWLGNVATVAI